MAKTAVPAGAQRNRRKVEALLVSAFPSVRFPGKASPYRGWLRDLQDHSFGSQGEPGQECALVPESDVTVYNVDVDIRDKDRFD